jgi:hypothetical protein
MSDDLFGDSLRLTARLVDRGDYADAVTVLRPWMDSGLPPFEKTIVSYNLAQVYAHLQQAAEVIAWFDRGIALERPLRRTLLAEGKAAWLANNGRGDEAVALWLALLGEDLLDADGRARVEANLATTLKAR